MFFWDEKNDGDVKVSAFLKFNFLFAFIDP